MNIGITGLSILGLLAVMPCSYAVEYEFRPTANDPFVPFYSALAKRDFSKQVAPVTQRFALRGIWKSSDGPWKAIVALRPGDGDADIEPQSLSVVVGDQIAAGIRVVAIEEQAVWVTENIELADGRAFQKKSRIGFDEEMSFEQ